VPLIKALTVPDDPIFVWGFNPQIYAFTDRRPASRYLYCSFPTGLVPWTNTALEVDTRYAIVPGALENLIADLAATEPKVVMDYAITPGREFGKYPVSDFPALDAWLSPRYGVIDRTALEPHAYRVLVRLDWEDETLADTWQPTERPVASIVSNGRLQTGLNHLLVNAYSADADVTGIGLWVQGRGVCRLELPATDLREWTIPVEVTDPARPLTLVPLVRRGEGPWQTGAPLEGQVLDLGVTDAQAQEFAIPVATTFEPAAGLKLSFDGMVELKPGRRDYAMHAPNIMRHRLPEGAVAVHGLFQIAAGAYAPENPSPSDGATFIVRLVQPSGQATELFRRLLEPGQRAEDRGLQPLGIRLPPDGVAGSQIEFEIDNGPGGVANSDWTSWVNLVIETSP
jgi:hypothetical protein